MELRRPRALVAALALLAASGCRGGGDEPHATPQPMETPTPAGHRTRTYRVPSESMEPTLHLGQIIEADVDAYRRSRPRVGDIIAFHPPARAGSAGEECAVLRPRGTLCRRASRRPSGDVTFVKRIVAGPGDRVQMVDGAIVRNGHRRPEPYARLCRPHDTIGECTFLGAYTVPEGRWFVLGDNRRASEDSRFFGPIRRRWIVGRVRG